MYIAYLHFFLCSLNGLLVAVEQAVLCIELSEVGRLLFADDFGKVSDSEEKLQRHICGRLLLSEEKTDR